MPRCIFRCIMIGLFFTACQQPLDDKFIISRNDSLSRHYFNDTTFIYVPLKVRYSAYTFIVDSTDNFYFYCMPEELPANGIYDEDESEYIGLTPNRVFLIPKGLEQQFFKTNVLDLNSSKAIKSIMIASFKDTISSDFVTSLVKTADTDEKIVAAVRLALPEEKDVIRAKLAGKYYEPKLIK